MEVFSSEWAAAWREQLNASDAFRRSGDGWRGSLVVATGAGKNGAAARAVLLDLHDGACRAARAADAGDLERADFLLRAEPEVWRRVLAGSLDPIWGLLSGRLRLERGSMSRLVPHARAASELVAAAGRLGGRFPGDGPAPTGAETAAEARPSERPAAEPAAEARAGRQGEGGGRHPGPPGAAPEPVYQSTSSRGLDRRCLPLRLWEKAKRAGIWNPSDFDFAADRRDWQGLDDAERDVLLRLTSLFQAGEESVTVELLPLIAAIAAEGRLEEEIYLTSFLWEEAKHVELFRRFLDEVAADASDLARYHTPAYRRIFYRELPAAMRRLETDRSPEAQARASVTYNLIVEGVMAETGYRGYGAILERHGLMPAMQQAVERLRGDESRHLAYGVFLLSRLVAEHGEPVWRAVERRMEELLGPTLELIAEVFAQYERMPFGLELADFTDFAQLQFRNRLERIERARRQGVEEVLYGGAA